MAALGTATAIFAALAWRNEYWSTFDRIHYTVVTIAAAIVVWVLRFWQLL